jgi:hypothetical protein
MLSTSPLERKLQLSGIVLILALLVEGLCLLLGHGPIAFMVFAGLSGALFAVGILLYLYSLVSAKAEPSKQ